MFKIICSLYDLKAKKHKPAVVNMNFLHVFEHCKPLTACDDFTGDGRFPDHQHADSTTQLVPGAAAVLLSNRRSRDSAAGAPNPSQSH